jgi:glycosyltransferase involved in cell wall biosynthesis
LKYAEKLAIKYSDHLISDSEIISEYLGKTRNVSSDFISYGAEVFSMADDSVPAAYGVSPNKYLMLVARMEPENNIETILDGYAESQTEKPILVVGKTENKFSHYLLKKFGSIRKVIFTGGIYDTPKLHSLRAFSSLYFHGHSAGGTNPSLLEAMASGALIAAHDNRFNKAVLGEDAIYFQNENCIKELVTRFQRNGVHEKMIKNNQEKIRVHYRWEEIVDRYENLFLKIVAEKNK